MRERKHNLTVGVQKELFAFNKQSCTVEETDGLQLLKRWIYQ
jgi:hypothetical protein